MKEEIDLTFKQNIGEYIKNLKKLGGKYKRFINQDECEEIINDVYIKIIKRYESGKLNITTNLKHYIGMMTYNHFIDFIKEEDKFREIHYTYTLNDNDNISEIDINYDELSDNYEEKNQKLILDILNKISTLLTPEEFSIFILKSINKKSCRKISVEMAIEYRKVRQIFKKSQSIINNEFGNKYNKINSKDE